MGSEMCIRDSYIAAFDSIFSSCSPCKYSTVRPEYLQGRLNHWAAIDRKVDQHLFKIGHSILGELCHLESFLTMHSGPAVCCNKDLVLLG